MKYLIMLSLLFASSAHAGPQGFAYEGKLLDPSGNPVPGPISFIIQIRSPGADGCLLYEENLNSVPVTNGYFSLDIGSGTRSGSNFHNTSTMAQVFAPSGNITGLSCDTAATSYSPAAADSRKLRVQFYDGAAWQTMTTDLVMKSAPFAMVADSLQGKGPSSFLQPNSSGPVLTQANLESVFASSSYVSELIALAAGTSTNYAKSSGGVFSGPIKVTAGALPGAPATGMIAVDSSASNALKWYDGSAWQTVGTGGGSVTSVSGGTGISVSGTGAAPVLGLANTSVATGSYGSASLIPTFSVDAQGRLTSAANVAVSDSSKLPLAGGTMTGALNMNYQNLNNIAQVSIADTGSLYLGKFTNAQEGGLLPALNGTTDRGRTWFNVDIKKMRMWDGTAAQSIGQVAGSDVTNGLGYTPVNKAGDTMAGMLALAADPTGNLEAATKQYVDSVSTTSAGAYIRKDGSTALVGDWDIDGVAGSGFKITGLAAPTVNDGAATKSYVDALTLNPLSQFAATTSAQLAGVLSNETGTGQAVFSVLPSIQGLYLAGSTGGGITLQAPAAGSTGSYTWPSALPGSNMVLQSSNSGNLSWVAASVGTVTSVSGGNGITVSGSAAAPVVSLVSGGAAGQVFRWDGSNWTPQTLVPADISGLSGQYMKMDGTNLSGNLKLNSQKLVGGINANGNLVLESTENGSKGSIVMNDKVSMMNGAIVQGYGVQPMFDFYRANGTAGAPTAISTNDIMGGVNGTGYDGTGMGIGAFIHMQASSGWTSGVHPTDIVFATASGASPLEQMRITSGGNVGIGTTNPSNKFHVVASGGYGSVFEQSMSGQPALLVKNSADTEAWITADPVQNLRIAGQGSREVRLGSLSSKVKLDAPLILAVGGTFGAGTVNHNNKPLVFLTGTITISCVSPGVIGQSLYVVDNGGPNITLTANSAACGGNQPIVAPTGLSGIRALHLINDGSAWIAVHIQN